MLYNLFVEINYIYQEGHMPLSFSKQHYGLYQRPYQGYDKVSYKVVT